VTTWMDRKQVHVSELAPTKVRLLQDFAIN
jgi:hypothetical protein